MKRPKIDLDVLTLTISVCIILILWPLLAPPVVS